MTKRFKKPYGGGYIEFYMPTTRRGYRNKRDRKHCKYYRLETNFCTKLFAKCVGPTLCNKFVDVQIENDSIYVGLEVVFPKRGKGVVTSIDEDICTVTFSSAKVQCKKSILIDVINKSKNDK